MSKLIGSKIRYNRKRQKLKSKELAEMIGSPPHFIWSIEKGTSENPSIDRLLSISRSLGVSMEYLCDDSRGVSDIDDPINVSLAYLLMSGKKDQEQVFALIKTLMEKEKERKAIEMKSYYEDFMKKSIEKMKRYATDEDARKAAEIFIRDIKFQEPDMIDFRQPILITEGK